jgi:acetylornithine deacetylase/succinyl-diaminopimelate desuccinylase-like protein
MPLLCAGFALACAGEAPAPPAGPPAPEALRARASRILAGAIRLRTVNPPGDELPLARYYAELLHAAGLEARVIETPAGSSRAGRGAAWGRLPGAGQRRPIVLLSHLDVVPAEPAEWSVDPFAGVQREGSLLGRGALDAKGISVVHLLAMTELARRGTSLERDVIFLATPDEETGGQDGAGYLVRQYPELLLEARYLLTEGGSIVLGTADRPSSWGVSVTEKAPCWVRVVARGESAHSAIPPESSAVSRLLAALEQVRRHALPLRVIPEVAQMYAILAPLAAPEDSAGFADLEQALAKDPAFRQRFLASPTRRALVQSTLNVTVLEGSARTNVLPSEASAHIDARLLPGERCEDLIEALHASIADPTVTLEALLALSSNSSPTDTPLFHAIERAAAAGDPGALVIPQVTLGFTDAHYFRALGLVAYGFTPFRHYEGEHRGIHGANERVSLDDLERGVELLIGVLQELDREEGSAPS